MLPDRLKKDIDGRRAEGSLRELSSSADLIDFTSNDYLGLIKSKKLEAKLQGDHFQSGTGGSRLLSGTKEYHLDVEKELAVFFQADSALIYNSGYTANLGLFSAILKRGDHVLYDELSHASIKDGIKLGYAKAVKFEHNNLHDLRTRLHGSEPGTYVVVEAVYSMDGDLAPLKEISELCSEFKARLIVDEAHSTGLFGSRGEGLSAEVGIQNDVFARVHTFGKAMGCQGAVVCGSRELKEYLINFSRPFIYTTAPSEHDVTAMKVSTRLCTEADVERMQLKNVVETFRKAASELNLPLLKSDTQIQGIEIPGVERVNEVAEKLRGFGFDVRPIRRPTVPEGKERIRICLHAFNMEEDIVRLTEKVKELIDE